MNTETGRNGRPSDSNASSPEEGSVSDLLRAGTANGRTSSETRSNDAIAALEKELENSEDRRLEERFQFIVGFVVLFDTIVFQAMETWSAPIVVGIMELVGLVSLANTCRVDVIMPILDRIAGAFPNGKRPKATEDD